METLSKQNRFYFMGIAITLVLLHHLCLRMDQEWCVSTFPFTPFIHGNLGVDIFFFASAYGCCASWDSNSHLRYFINRVERIWPQYILFLVIVLFVFFSRWSLPHKAKVSFLCLTGIAPISRFHTYVEWYVPSLLLVYWTLPIMKHCLEMAFIKRRCVGTVLLIACSYIAYRMLSTEILYWLLQLRIPIILCGIVAYIKRDDKEYLIKLYVTMLLLSMFSREDMLIRSMIIPLVMVTLSLVDLSNLPFRRFFSWIGYHSFEIFLAQTITTQFVMKEFFWKDKWTFLLIVICLTILLSIVFGLWQLMFNKVKDRVVSLMKTRAEQSH